MESDRRDFLKKTTALAVSATALPAIRLIPKPIEEKPIDGLEKWRLELGGIILYDKDRNIIADRKLENLSMGRNDTVVITYTFSIG